MLFALALLWGDIVRGSSKWVEWRTERAKQKTADLRARHDRSDLGRQQRDTLNRMNDLDQNGNATLGYLVTRAKQAAYEDISNAALCELCDRGLMVRTLVEFGLQKAHFRIADFVWDEINLTKNCETIMAWTGKYDPPWHVPGLPRPLAGY